MYMINIISTDFSLNFDYFPNQIVPCRLIRLFFILFSVLKGLFLHKKIDLNLIEVCFRVLSHHCMNFVIDMPPQAS